MFPRDSGGCRSLTRSLSFHIMGSLPPRWTRRKASGGVIAFMRDLGLLGGATAEPLRRVFLLRRPYHGAAVFPAARSRPEV